MALADEKYNELVEEINKNGKWDKDGDVRTVYADGEKAYTKSVFGVQVKFPKGAIPLLTNKKVFELTSKKEMMLFWIHQTVQEKDFKEHNVKVWDQWFNKDGNLGRSYAYQFESHRHHEREVVEVKKVTKKHHGKVTNDLLFPILECNFDSNSKYVGKVMDSNNFGKFRIIDIKERDKQTMAKVQFLDTGFVVEKDIRNVLRGELKDPYRRNSFGVGFAGNFKSVKNFKPEEVKYLWGIWHKMLARCYQKDNANFKNYGDKGVFVDERWHCFENFLRDIRYLPQFFLAKEDGFEGWNLDKDYFQSNFYGPESCVWITRSENQLYKSNSYPVEITFPNGNKKIFVNISEASRLTGLERKYLTKCAKGEKDSFKGHTVEIVEGIYRYELSRNQVVELLKQIKNNPYSRRLGTAFWNWADVIRKMLQECAWATEWNVRDGQLDLILIQRSADLGLGVVFNWFQYYVLQCMIAHVNGLEVGEFTHQIGNLHYYDRHEETLLEQIKNECYEQPTLKINPEVKDFFDFTPEDIKVENYEHGPFVSMEVAE